MKRFSVSCFALLLAFALVTPASFASDKKKDPDEIGLTLTQTKVIEDFRTADRSRRPWAYAVRSGTR